MPRDPFAALNEAAAATAASYDPSNARVVLGMMEGLPGAIDSMAAMFDAMGVKTVEGFPINTSPGEMLRTLSSTFRPAREHAAETGSTLKRSHAKDIARVDGETGRRHEEKWDVAANREG